MRKIAQFRIQQTSFMLLALALFLILVFIFWITIKYRSLQSVATLAEEQKAILMVEYIAGMTEFNCANKQYCIDTDKIMMLKNMSAYKDYWASSIKIRRVYPASDKEVECTLGNYPNCNTYTIKAGGDSSVGSFVALCRYENKEGYTKKICELGRIAIGYEIKE